MSLITDGFGRVLGPTVNIGDAESGTDTNKTWAVVEANSNMVLDGSRLKWSSLILGTGEWSASIGDASTKNIDLRIAVPVFSTPTAVFKSIELCGRWTSHFDKYILRWTNDQDISNNGVIEAVREYGGTKRIGNAISRVNPGAFFLRAQIETRRDDVALRLKMYTGTEPAAWDLERFDNSDTRRLSGKYALRLINAAGTAPDELDDFVVSEMVPQVMVPDSDVSAGTWTDEAGGVTNLFSHIDEPDPANDADYIKSVVDPASALVKFGMSNPAGTPSAGNYSINIRHKKAP